MNVNIPPSDRTPIVGVIDPDNYTSGSTETTGWIAAEEFENFKATVMAGDMAAGATIDAKIEEATDDGGTDSQDLSGKAITQMTQASDDDSNEQAIINLRQDELSAGYTHFRLSVSVGSAAADMAAIVEGYDARYEPESQPSSVTETVI